MKRLLAPGLALALMLSLVSCTAPQTETPPPEEESPTLSAPTQTNSGVVTHWEVLEEDGEEPLELYYARWYDRPTYELIPLEGGYGTLVPFVGSMPPDFSWGGVYQYGLMTMDGTIVVDTTYSSVDRLALPDADGLLKSRLPVLSLTEDDYVPEGDYPTASKRYGAAALDGSWAIPVEYEGIYPFAQDGFFLWKEGVIYSYDLDGQLLTSFPYSGAPWLGEDDSLPFWRSGVLAGSTPEGESCLIDLRTGLTRVLEGVSGLSWPGDGYIPARNEEGLWGCIDLEGNWVIPARYDDLSFAGSGVFWAYSEETGERYLNAQGQEVPEAERERLWEERNARFLDFNAIPDLYTGEVYSMQRTTDGGYDILDAQGNVLGHGYAFNDANTQAHSVVNGLVLNIDGLTAGYKDLNGNWVFRILLAEAGED